MIRWSLGLGVVLFSVVAFAQAPARVNDADRSEIQALVAGYADALGTCRAGAFADLFAPDSGYFASGFRGRVQGRDKLVELVESERHCRGAAPGRSAFSVPAVVLDPTSAGVFGIADLGGAGQYQDEYVRTADGWRFASRTVLTPPEMTAGLDAHEMLAIHRLSNDLETSDVYEVDDSGERRFLASGVVIGVGDGSVTGRVYVGGGYYEDVYEKTAPGEWRIESREFVAAPTP